jgi:hypothetical protein
MKKNPSASDMGKVGGRARAKALTAEERQEIARNAIKARWDRVREGGKDIAVESVGPCNPPKKEKS